MISRPRPCSTISSGPAFSTTASGRRARMTRSASASPGTMSASDSRARSGCRVRSICRSRAERTVFRHMPWCSRRITASKPRPASSSNPSSNIPFGQAARAQCRMPFWSAPKRMSTFDVGPCSATWPSTRDHGASRAFAGLGASTSHPYIGMTSLFRTSNGDRCRRATVLRQFFSKGRSDTLCV